MGLVNAMAIWSRFIDTAMDGLHDFVLCYADDILIFTKSTSIDDHINDLERVFIQLDKYGIKVKASKLKIGLKEMPFLGVVITEDGIKPNPAKTAAIEKLAYPTSLKELRSMIGMFAYYRRFIEKFSEVASPLYEQAKKHTHNPRNAKGIILTEESKAAFDFLKKAITQEPVMLHYPNWDIPFEIHTDASSKAVAAILCQRIDGKERVIMYASKTLNKGEEKYHIYEKEGLAVVWAAEIFRKYIRNKRTVVRTDCSALQWLKSREIGSRVMRWVVRLAEFDLDIQHRRGKNSCNVDGITRAPPPENKEFENTGIEPLYDTVSVVMGEGGKRRAPLREYWEQKLRESREKEKGEEEEKETEKEERKEEHEGEIVEIEEKSERERKEEEEKRPFFDCKEEKEARSKEDFVRAQAEEGSKCMQFVRNTSEPEREEFHIPHKTG